MRTPFILTFLLFCSLAVLGQVDDDEIVRLGKQFGLKRVAVYVIGEDAGMNKVLGTKLQTAIARSEGYSAVERTAEFLTELSKEQKYQRTGAVDDSDISRLGKQFGVQYVCVAAVSEAFSEKYISARLIDVESAQVEGTASSSGAIRSLPDIMTAANTVSDELLSSLRNDGGSNLKKVAVYIVKNDAAKNIGRVLGDKLVAGFTSSGRYMAIERTNGFLAQLSKEQKYQRTGAVDDSDISRLGKQFGVQYVCVADVSDVFGEKFVSARLIDVETAEIVNSHDVGGSINRMDDCVRMANEIASKLSVATFKEQALIERLRQEEQARIERQRQEEQARIERQKMDEEEKRRQDSIRQNTVYNILADRHDNFEDLDGKYVDLGLPSGILWKVKSEKETCDYYSAMDKFGNKLPTVEQWEELKTCCIWVRQKDGYKVIGPNNQTILLRSNNKENYWAYKYGVSETAACCVCLNENDVSMETLMATTNGNICLVDARDKELLNLKINSNLECANMVNGGGVEVGDLSQYPDGETAYYQFVNNNIKYPSLGLEQGIQGSVRFRFIVEVSGRITNVEVTRAPKVQRVSGSTEETSFPDEFFRLIKLMPRWKPAYNSENHPTRSFLSGLIRFSLS